MPDLAIRLDRVSKKFRRGERHDSLRDLFPALARAWTRSPGGPAALGAEEFWALDDVSLDVPRGEALGVIGRNGAGKSTLLKLLSGIMRPTRGTVAVSGRLSGLIEIGAGFHEDLTGRENIVLNGVILGMSRAEVRRKFDEIVEFSGLADFIDTPVKRYSSGMFARLGFSVAAHLEPDILVIDEVLSVGDLLFQAKGVEKMKSVARAGATVVFVSHNLAAVADLCTRCLLLAGGRPAYDGPTSETIRIYMSQLREAGDATAGRPVVVLDVTVRGVGGPRFDFEAGQKAWVTVTAKAHEPCRGLSIGLHLLNQRYLEVFNTSSQRLGAPARDLGAGETFTCEFELDLHLAAGTFPIGVTVFRQETQEEFDRREPAGSLLVRSPIDVRGAANLYPKVRVF